MDPPSDKEIVVDYTFHSNNSWMSYFHPQNHPVLPVRHFHWLLRSLSFDSAPIISH